MRGVLTVKWCLICVTETLHASHFLDKEGMPRVSYVKRKRQEFQTQWDSTHVHHLKSIWFTTHLKIDVTLVSVCYVKRHADVTAQQRII